MAQAAPLATPEVELTYEMPEQVTLFTDAWRRIRRNRLALLGGVIILLLFIVALISIVWTPYPTWLQAVGPTSPPPHAASIGPRLGRPRHLEPDHGRRPDHHRGGRRQRDHREPDRDSARLDGRLLPRPGRHDHLVLHQHLVRDPGPARGADPGLRAVGRAAPDPARRVRDRPGVLAHEVDGRGAPGARPVAVPPGAGVRGGRSYVGRA